ncbi:protoheme IX farnesyltransferase [Chitinibacter bivalviorum]|uniref:Protoheme IX farnesyltransferase n=1 Tax=Chitinibacter bivalviorum TaxID=2739434 RepID=A0A7H9BL18_9NEIS|nr:heme o synthase [Chitinibacter bivalviorum]QLG89273.1 protoheme IX farnesyltransferase [Chitinibacter bivalviorum]
MTTLSLHTSATLWRELVRLGKPRVVALIVFCAWIGMLLASEGEIDIRTMLAAVIGIALVASGAAAANCLFEAERDAHMLRTHLRPLPRGTVSLQWAAMYALLLTLTGAVLLAVWVNTLTLYLTLGTFIAYAVVYTRWLKPASPQNIVIGGAAGAMPPVLGWAAMTGGVSAEAATLFLIIYAWTPPHFWALALYRMEDYRKVGLPMLPVTHGRDFTRLSIWLYSWILAATTLLPLALGFSSVVYLVAMLGLNGWFLRGAWQVYQQGSDELARRLFRISIAYLAYLFMALLLDHYLQRWI